MKTGKSLMELAMEVERQAAMKKDFIAPSNLVRFHANPTSREVRMEVPKIGDFAINTLAHAQLADNAGIPKAYYDRTLASHPGLLAQQINHWFTVTPQKRMVRTLDNYARAWLSDRYRPLDNFDLLSSLIPYVVERQGDMVVASSEVTERRLYLKLTVPSLVGPGAKVGDEVCAGVAISNSEVGDGSLSVDPFIEILRCTNGMKVAKFGKRRNHVGKSNGSDDAAEFYQNDTQQAMDVAFFKQIRDTVKGVLEPAGFQKILDHIRESGENKIEAKPEDVVEVLANKYQFSAGTREGIFRQLIDSGNGLNRWGLLNAVNRQAQDEADYDEASRLESISGDILTLDPSQWKAISNATDLVPIARRKKASTN